MYRIEGMRSLGHSWFICEWDTLKQVYDYFWHYKRVCGKSPTVPIKVIGPDWTVIVHLR